MEAAQHGRYGHPDATLILVAFRHGLRAAEICDPEWSQVEFDAWAHGKTYAIALDGEHPRCSLRRTKKGAASVTKRPSFGVRARVRLNKPSTLSTVRTRRFIRCHREPDAVWDGCIAPLPARSQAPPVARRSRCGSA